MTLSEGEPAPAISAGNHRGESVDLSFEDPTVLYFYPRDETPGCTVEARQFDVELTTYREAGVGVYGVSTDDVASHARFAESEDLEFDLLADPDGTIAERFGVTVDPATGKADRTTFVLADGTVHAVYRSVSPDGHARAVLEDLLESGLASLE